MARSNTGSTANYLAVGSTPVVGVPVTWAGWGNFVNVTHTALFLNISDSVGTSYMAVGMDGTNSYAKGAGRIAVDPGGGNAQVAASLSAPSAGVWCHVAGVMTTTTSRTAYLDGVAGTASTVLATPSGWNRMSLGAYRTNTTTFSPINGSFAECGLWNAALDAAEIAGLAAGIPPQLVRPTALVGYWRVLGQDSPETDIVGQRAMTITGTMAAAAHPRIYTPGSVQIGVPSAAATAPVGRTFTFLQAVNRASTY